jgi:hypothetical protein
MTIMRRISHAELTRRPVVSLTSALLCGALLVFLDGAARAAEGTALYIDEQGSVGIGTQKPRSPLSVSGGAAIGSQEFVERNAAPGRGLVVEGRVGIGNPAPEAPLDVSGDAVIGGQVRIGGAPDPASSRPLDIAAPGGIRIRQTASASEQNEIFFQDNGQIRSRDDSHRIIFDRESNRMELREYGEIVFSAGATAGQRTQTVTMSAGGMTVNGSITAAVRYQRDDEPETTYQKPLQRYHLSLTAERYGGRTRTIPKDVLESLCGKPDGCQVRLGMTRWGTGKETETASRSFLFYYSPSDGHWRVSDGDRSGIAGNGRTEHAYSIWDTCYFTDGSYAGFKDQADKGTGMQLLVWAGYKNPRRTCELTLIP